LRKHNDKVLWGQVEKLGKGTKASYDSEKKIITFCFNRSPQTPSELLRSLRELLMKELKELGYDSRMKYNGEVIVENVSQEDVVLVRKNHKLSIHLNKKQTGEKENDLSGWQCRLCRKSQQSKMNSIDKIAVELSLVKGQAF
jgi:hypothetical protein